MHSNFTRPKAARPFGGFPLRIPLRLRLLAAVLFSVCGLVVTHSIGDLETEHFFLFLLLAVVASCWVGGWPAGVLATGLTTAGPLLWMHGFAHDQDTMRFTTFVVSCAILCWIAGVIDARRKTQITLQEDEERLRLALKAGDAWTWEWDPKTGIVHRSSEALGILGSNPTTLTDELEHTLQSISELTDIDIAIKDEFAAGRRGAIHTS